MTWFNLTRRVRKWDNVLPMLYPFDLETSDIDQSGMDREIEEGNRICYANGPLGLKICLLDQSDENAAQMVNNRMLREWQTSLENLLPDAIRNLERDILPNVVPVRLEESPVDIAFLEGAASYTASLILSAGLWPKIGFRPQDLAISLPHRELIYFGDRSSLGSQLCLRKLTSEMFAAGSYLPKHLLFDGVAIHDADAPFNWKKLTLE